MLAESCGRTPLSSRARPKAETRDPSSQRPSSSNRKYGSRLARFALGRDDSHTLRASSLHRRDDARMLQRSGIQLLSDHLLVGVDVEHRLDRGEVRYGAWLTREVIALQEIRI